MPRKPRIFCFTGIYHIIFRSINQHIIFEEDADYHKFLSILKDSKTNYDIDILAYCLMDNHVHLAIYAAQDDLSPYLQSVESRFARWYNTKYSRSGHLFQDRFHSVPIETTAQFLATLVYIHNNPVKASICRFPSEYRWSSFNAFYGSNNEILNLNRCIEMAGSRKYLMQYFATHMDSEDIVLHSTCYSVENNSPRHFLTDEKALEVFNKVTRLSSTAEVISLPKKTRNDFICRLHQEGLTQKQIARLMDVSVTTVKRVAIMNH